MLYQSLKLTNGIWILAELRIQPGNPNYTVRSRGRGCASCACSQADAVNLTQGLGIPTGLEKKRYTTELLCYQWVGIMPTQHRAFICQGYPEIKPRDISEKALPGHPSPSSKQEEIYALLAPAAEPGCLGVGGALGSCWHQLGLVGRCCLAGIAHPCVALPFLFTPLLRICIPLLKHFSPGGIPTRNFKRNPRSGELEGESRRWQVLKHVYDEA